MTYLPNQLSAEEKLLLSLCRLEFTTGQKEEIRIFMKEVKNWDHFVEIANEHGIIALAWFNITSSGNSSQIPPQNLSKLYQGYLASLARNSYLYKHLSEIIEIAEKENIMIILLKGLALEKTVYGDKGLRQMNDMDILADNEKAEILWQVLLKNGFSSQPVKSSLYLKYLLPFIGKHLPALLKDDCSVEIHFRLFDKNDLYLTGKLSESASLLQISDKKVYVLPVLICFLYLVSHMAEHDRTGGSQLRQYADLVVLLDSYYNDIISPDLLKAASEADLKKVLIGKLYLLKEFWGVSYPGWIEEEIREIGKEEQTDLFLRYLQKPKGNPVEDETSNYKRQIRSLPGKREKIIFITGFLFPSVEFMKRRYNIKKGFVIPLYYPFRWWNLVTKMMGWGKKG
jgi:hypothetical protein